MATKRTVRKTIDIDQKYYQALRWSILIAIVAGFVLIRPFFSVIVISLITAFLATPIYNWILKRTNKSGVAASLTFIATLVIIIIPIIIILAVTVYQAKVIVDDIGHLATETEYHNFLQNALNSINQYLSNLTGKSINITSAEVWNQIAKYASSVASFILNTLTSWVGSIGSIFANIILYLYIFTGVLVNKDKLINLFEKINPLGHDIADLYLEKAGAMTKGMVGGQFTIAAIQGLVSALSLYITGVPYFAFFLLILTFLSVIPLGAGIVTIPIGIVRILMGDVWQGLFIILTHVIVVTNIDNVLKPKLVPKSVRLHPALTLLAVFGGMGLFGILGIVIGPVIMVLITSTIEVYAKTIPSKKELEAAK